MCRNVLLNECGRTPIIFPYMGNNIKVLGVILSLDIHYRFCIFNPSFNLCLE